MGIFNRIRDMFNSGELKPAEHIGQIELVKNEANKASELTWGYNEAYFDHMREQKSQTPKTPEQVNVESLKKEIEGGNRPQLGNIEQNQREEEEHSMDI